VAYEQPTWEHHTAGTASSSPPGLLPTPAAGNFNDGESVESWQARKERELAKGINGNGIGLPLGMAVRMLNGSSADPPADAVTALLPTPQSRDGDDSSRSMSPETARRRFAQGKRNLDDGIAMLLPTPCATDAKGTRTASSGRQPDSRHHSGETLLDVFWTGEPTSPPSDAGN
jgi:hypothetical protein